ncbi:MAG: hypothetical protein AAF004_07565 [Pseudomonadota bacterium]
MTDSMQQRSSWEHQNQSNTKRLAVWTIAWLITTALLAFGPKFLWDYNSTVSIAALLLNLATGIAMVLANKQLLQNLDELERRIFLDASATTLGVGLVFAGTYQLMEGIKLLPFEPRIAHLMIVMALTFLIATFSGKRRFS